ncbi:hypothetical protein FOL47_005541 [Perkinsus chesapeaki]|uniref:Uncharacterized protein n=1 Tax=Perkinsus chesapeaki TaxID=330153 RepID=A0A7J6LX02_PERCH|nr:hypothetical protein FOL47_005541 [Perkinsus chesapeaki]
MSRATFLIPHYFISVIIAANVADYNYEFQVETKRHCIDGLQDAKGNPASCSRSIAFETAGLTLPGMEDGTLTTRSHVIIASDGSEVKVEAHPSYPYQYFINTMTADSFIVEHILNGESHLVGQTASRFRTAPPALSGFTSLVNDGWLFRGSVKKDGAMVNEWVKESFQGVDNATGANLSGIYLANLAPDTWTLYMDERNEKPVYLIATNGGHDHVVHQEMKFSNFERKSGQLSAEDARHRLNEMYGIKNVLKATDDPKREDLDDGFSNWRGELLSGYTPTDFSHPPDAADWMPHRRLRSSEIIPYFTIEEGTAAARYFGKLGNRPRKLMTLFDFQLPLSCEDRGSKDEICIFANCDGSGLQASLSLSVGIRFPDVVQPERMLEFSLAARYSLSPDNKDLHLGLSVTAAGCAIVWQMGEGIFLRITLCLTASGSGQYSSGTGALAASVGASVSFSVRAQIIGSIIDFTLSAEIGLTIAPKNVVTVYGKIGVSHSTLIAGASIAFDMTIATADNLLNRWEFSSGVTLHAWITLVCWRPSWSIRHRLVSVGPITF